jgi:dihydroorotase
VSAAAAAAASTQQQTLTITTPDDWHLHVRDGDNMRSVVPHTAAHFARAIIMPNLVPPVTNTQLVRGTPTNTSSSGSSWQQH